LCARHPDGGSAIGSGGVTGAGGIIGAGGSIRADAQASPVDGNAPYADACQAVDNSTFVSTEEHECGLTPTGIGMCKWTLSFTNNGASRKISWRLSDYMLTLDYQCDGFTLTAKASGAISGYTGTYDPATKILHWDDFDYLKDVPKP
jgi:hypothetical protein